MKKIKEDCPIQEKTYQALKNLVLVSSEMQEEMLKNKIYHANQLDFLNEFCTIDLRTSRRGGHSTASARVGYEFFNNVLFLSPNHMMGQNLMRHFADSVNESGERIYSSTRNEITVKESNSNKFSTYKFQGYEGFAEKDRSKGFGGNTSLECKIKGWQFEAIIVDPAFGMKRKQKRALSELFVTRTAYVDKRFLIYVG
jgi:hypothetical protein